MSAKLDAAAAELQEKISGSGFSGTVKFDVEEEGAILIDGETVSVGDGGDDPDLTISGSLDTFRAMFEGDLSPTTAYMTGKIRIDGNMGLAMKLSQFL